MAAQPILFSGAEHADPERLAAVLKQSGLGEPAAAVQHLAPVRLTAAWAQRLKQDPTLQGVLLYRKPLAVIVEQLAQGVSGPEAVSNWLNQVRPVLAAHRYARERCLLIEQDSALAAPADFVRNVSRRLGLALQAPAEVAAAVKQPEADPMHLLLARSALHDSIEARRTAAELLAGSLALPSHQPHQPDTLPLTTLAEKVRERVASLTRERDRLTEENGLLLQQLQQVQSAVEEYAAGNRGQRDDKEVERLTRRVQQLEHRVRYFENSRSWKITAPMRAVLKRLKRA